MKLEAWVPAGAEEALKHGWERREVDEKSLPLSQSPIVGLREVQKVEKSGVIVSRQQDVQPLWQNNILVTLTFWPQPLSSQCGSNPTRCK